MKPHLILAHELWAKLVSPQDLVIDATCGNGHDTLALVKLAKHVYSIDIQPDALESAKKRTVGFEDNITFVQGCHSQFPNEIEKGSIKLVVYNLGYLPGGDKNKTTMWETTVESIRRALELIVDGGMVCVTCYPGHAEGEREQELLLKYVSGLDQKFVCCHHEWVNRPRSPTLLTIEKIC